MTPAIIDPYLKIQAALARRQHRRRARPTPASIATAATALGAPAMKIDTAAAAARRRRPSIDGRARQVRRAERGASIAYIDRPAADAARGRQGRVLPDGAASRGCRRATRIANPYYGNDDADLRQLPVNISFTQAHARPTDWMSCSTKTTRVRSSRSTSGITSARRTSGRATPASRTCSST